MKWFVSVMLISGIFFSGCTQPLASLFPEKPAERWEWKTKPVLYDVGNLYDYINGEAELYHTYDFQELASLTYALGGVEDTSFVVDIYDMGTAENAFGIYSSYRYPDYQFENIGAEAMVSDFGIKFYKDRYLVDCKAGDLSKNTSRTMKLVAEKVAERIGGEESPPKLTRLLPKSGQMPKTLRYVAREILNQSFLPGGLEAKYSAGSGEATAVIVFFDSDDLAIEALRQMETFYRGREAAIKPLDSGPGWIVQTPYRGWGIFQPASTYLIAILDLESPEDGKALIKSISKNLTNEG